MDADNSRDTGPSPHSGTNDGLVDPLVEQMSGVLRLTSRPAAATRQAQLARRSSDTDRASTVSTLPTPEPITVRSRDGLRWLPAPSEQTRTVGTRNTSTSGEELTASAPVERHVCNAAVCAVTTLLETTELLEIILSSLPTRGILNLRRVSRHWNATIQQSPQLRLHFFYYPQFMWPADEFRLLPLSMPGLSIDLGAPIHLGQWIQVSLTSEVARRISPKPPPTRRVRSRSFFEGLRGGLGTRAGPSTDPWPTSSAKAAETVNSTLQYADLFITQPPVVAMQAFVLSDPGRTLAYEDDAADDYDEDVPVACAKLACDAGITLGFLAETAQSLLSSNKVVGNDGARVAFRAIVSFCKNDSAPRKRSFARSITSIQ